MSRETPRTVRTSRNCFLETDSRRDALQTLCRGVGEREPFLLITGDVGTGKTALAHEAVQRWGKRARVALVANPAMTCTEMVEEIIHRFGVEPPTGASKPRLLACIERIVTDAADTHKVPVVVIDDAHALTVEHLSELRYLVNGALANGRVLEVLLVGLPELELRLDDPALAALRQQVAGRYRTEAFTPDETRRFLHEVMHASESGARGPFSREKCREIHESSRGVVRIVQALARDALRDWEPEPATAPARSPKDVQPGQHQAAAQARVEAAVESEPTPRGPERTQDPVPDSHGPRGDAVPVDDGEPPERTSDDPGVQSWVGRFIAADEPRFGDLLMAEPTTKYAETSEDAGSGSAQSSAGPAAPHRGRRRRHGRRKAGVVTAAAIITLAASAIVFLIPRMRDAAQEDAPPAATASAEATRDSTTVENPETTAGRDDAKSKRTSREKSNAASADPIRHYALEVGAHRDRYAAEMERERLVAATGLKGWIVTEPDELGDVFHVVLGAYSSRERAEWGSGHLTENALVATARIIPLPPRIKRR